MAREYGRYGIRVSTISPGCMCVYPEGLKIETIRRKFHESRCGIGEMVTILVTQRLFLLRTKQKFITGVKYICRWWC